MQRNDYLFILSIFLLWRVGLFFISAQAQLFLPFQTSFPYVDIILMREEVPPWMRAWANFDGVHYIVIENQGYRSLGLIQAFFPLYPLLLGSFHKLLSVSIILLGVSFSSLFFLGAMIFLYDLVRKTNSVSLARKTLLILVTFPTSFYFGAVYSESLFLFIIAVIFWASYHKNWWIVAVLSVLASANRLVGLFIIPATIVQIWIAQTHGVREKILHPSTQLLRATVIQLVGMAGLIGYMIYLWTLFGDPLLFFHVQGDFGAGRQESIILLPQIVWRYLKMIVMLPMSLLKYAILQEFVMTISGGVLLTAAIKLRKHFRLSWQMLLFSVGAFFLPTLTGTFSSMPRYVLVCVPMYVVLAAMLKKKTLLIPYVVGSTFLLIINTILFVQGYWVA